MSLANAEQEVLAGPLTEFDGRLLALWELAHALEWVALSGFVVTLATPFRSGSGTMNGVLFILASLALVPLLTLLASATARLKLAQATRLFLALGIDFRRPGSDYFVVMRQGGLRWPRFAVIASNLKHGPATVRPGQRTCSGGISRQGGSTLPTASRACAPTCVSNAITGSEWAGGVPMVLRSGQVHLLRPVFRKMPGKRA